MEIAFKFFICSSQMLGAYAASGLFTAPIVRLFWNAVIPSICGLPMLTYWQAYLLYLLCAILFKSSFTFPSNN